MTSAVAAAQHHQNVAAVHAMMTRQFPPFGYPPPFAYNPAFQQQLQLQLRQAANARQQMQQQQQQGNVGVQPAPDFARMFCAPAPNMGIYQPPLQQQQQTQPQQAQLQNPSISQPNNAGSGTDQNNVINNPN